MESVLERLKEYCIKDCYIITGEDSDLLKILPILYGNGFRFFYRSQIIFITFNNFSDDD